MSSKGFYSEKTGDIWEHAAVVRNLADDFSAKHHPIYGNELPHAFNSPYHLVVALVSKYLKLDAITSLLIFGFFNLLLVNFSLYFLIPKNKKGSIYFVLLCILFLWYKPPHFSGFVSFEVLPYIFSYPSLFALGLILLFNLLLQHYLILQKKTLLYEVAFCIISFMLILSHPISFSALIATVSANIFLNYGKKRKVFLSIIAIIIGVMLAMLWPYFSLMDLVVKSSHYFNEINNKFYSHTLLLIAHPILFILLLIAISHYKKIKIDFFYKWLLLSVSILSIMYILGFIFGISSLSRTSSFLIFLLQFMVGVLLFDGIKKISQFSYFTKTLTIICFVYLSYKIYTFNSFIPIIDERENLCELKSIINTTEKGALILSDLETSWKIPAHGRFVIASIHPQAFTSDYLLRKRVVKAFFIRQSNFRAKRFILKKYQPNYLLIDKRSYDVNYFPKLKIIQSSKNYLLLKF